MRLNVFFHGRPTRVRPSETLRFSHGANSNECQWRLRKQGVGLVSCFFWIIERAFHRFSGLQTRGSPLRPYCQAITVTFTGNFVRGGIWVNTKVLPEISAGPSRTRYFTGKPEVARASSFSDFVPARWSEMAE